jgi:hypothetical protein
MSAPQVSSAFIDLATYGELESYLYGRPSIKDYNDMYPRSIKQTLAIPVVILIIFFLIYIKG